MFFYLRIHTNDPERKGQHNSECNFPTGRPVRPLRTREFPSSLVVPSIIFSFLLFFLQLLLSYTFFVRRSDQDGECSFNDTRTIRAI